jgi:hypothetical protein
MPKSMSGLGLGPGTVITDTVIRLLSAPGAITTTPRTLAPLTAITARAGLSVDSLSAPARGTTDTGDAVDGVAVATTVAAATTAGQAMVVGIAVA